MGSTTDKIIGATNEALGNLEKGIGEMVGSEAWTDEGIAKELKGRRQHAKGEAKAAQEDAVDAGTDPAKPADDLTGAQSPESDEGKPRDLDITPLPA